MPDAASLLRRSRRTLVVVAHPDDETVGAGALLARHADAVSVLHVTDGAPRERRWWGVPELPSRAAYARVRRRELLAALRLAGLGEDRVRSLGVRDQEASFGMADLARRLAAVVAGERPDVVLTQPYEGGHPDHDATAFAVGAAVRLLERAGLTAPSLLELTSYRCAPDGGIAVCEFLAAHGTAVVTHRLTESERALKRRMLASFVTQQETLAPFPVDVERFRIAPAYRFASPPHPGTLYYERFEWGCTGAEWRALAREAMAALGLDPEGPS